jgi:hypothetical protein
MDKILEALSTMLPEDQLTEVSSELNKMLEESKKELEAEFQTNLEEAYEKMTAELAEAEKTAYEGYQQALAVITDQENRRDAMKEEFEKMLEEQYEDAYKMVLEERGKNDSIESTMYEEYDGKLNDMKNYVVDKLDEFLQQKGKEIYEQARRDIVNDPRMAEHKVALDKISEVVQDFISEEELTFSTSKKLDEARGELDKLRSQVRIMEGRNIRISTENTKMQEQLGEAAQVLKEYRETAQEEEVLTEQKERAKKAAKASGRGHTVTDDKLIAEFSEPEVAEEPDDEPKSMLNEEQLKLAGLR